MYQDLGLLIFVDSLGEGCSHVGAVLFKVGGSCKKWLHFSNFERTSMESSFQQKGKMDMILLVFIEFIPCILVA